MTANRKGCLIVSAGGFLFLCLIVWELVFRSPPAPVQNPRVAEARDPRFVSAKAEDAAAKRASDAKAEEAKRKAAMAALPAETQIANATTVFNCYRARKEWSLASVRGKKTVEPSCKPVEDAAFTDALTGLYYVPQTSPKYSVARAFAKKMLDYKAAVGAEANELFNEHLRTEFANEAEVKFLDQGMSVTVTASGKAHTVLTIKYILMSKATAYAISNKSEFLDRCRERGFKTVRLTDGYDETYTYQLDK